MVLIIAVRWGLRKLLRSTRRVRDRVLGSFIVFGVRADMTVFVSLPLPPAWLIHGPVNTHHGPRGQEGAATMAGPAAERPADREQLRVGPTAGAPSMDWTATSPSAPRGST